MATLSSSLVKKLVSVTNDSSSTATSSGTAYGTVTVSGDKTYVLIDGGTVITPVVAGADARDQDRVIVTIENHTATITSNLTNPASSYTATETEEEITNYLNDESEDGYLSVVSAYVGDLTVDTAYIDTLLTNYAQISYLEGDYLSYVEGYIGTLYADTAYIDTLLANYAQISYLETDYLEAVDAYIENLTVEDLEAGTITAKYITTNYLDANYITAESIQATYADIQLANVAVASVGTLLANVGLISDMTIKDGYVTGELSSVTINADTIVAGTLAVDRLLITGEDSIVYEINATCGGLTETQLTEEQYQEAISGTALVARSVTAERIAASTITAFELNVESITADEAFMNSLTATSIFANAVSTNSVVVGAVNNAIVDQQILYATSSSPYVAPNESATWSEDMPTKQSGVYIWMKFINTYGETYTDDDGNIVHVTYESEPTCMSGLDGTDGDGTSGIGIVDFTNYYLVSTESSGVNTTTSGWTNTPQSMTSTYKYLWNYELITYSDGSTYTSTPAVIGVYGDPGENGADGTTLYATCDTAASTITKKAYLTNSNVSFSLEIGVVVSVTFTYTNTASSPLLSVEDGSAYPIYYQGSTINAGYLIKDMVLMFCFTGSEWEYTGYVNTNDCTKFTGSIYASSTITANNIIVGNSSGYHNLKLGLSFDISYPILLAGSSASAGSICTDNYTETNFTVTYTQSITLTAYKYVYIKGDLNGTTFTPISTTPLTQTVPTAVETTGKCYIRLGLAYSTTGIHLETNHEIFMFYGGSFQSLGSTAGQIVANWCYLDDVTYIDGGNLYAGTVTANAIAANAITTKHLAVSLGGNLYPNYDTFEQITDNSLYYSKSSTAEVALDTSTAFYGSKCLRIYANGSDAYVYLGCSANGYGCIPVTTGYIYRISCYVKSSSTSTIQLYAIRHSSKTTTSNAYTYTSVSVGTSWTRVELTFSGASASYPYLSLRVDNDTSGTYAYFDAFQVEIIDDASYETSAFSPSGTTTIDGANITTGTINANSIFSQSITFTGSIYATGTDSDGNTYEVYILPGTNTNNDFLVVHNVTEGTYPFYVRANGTACFANWSISSKKIYGGTSTTGVAVMQAPTSSTTYVFAAGGTSHSSYADCPFRVTKAGKLYAKAAVLEGSVYLYDDENAKNVQAMHADGGVCFDSYCYFDEDSAGDSATFEGHVTFNSSITGSVTFDGNVYIPTSGTSGVVRIGGSTAASYVSSFTCYANNIYFRSQGSSPTFSVGTGTYPLTSTFYGSTSFYKRSTSDPGSFTIGESSYPWNVGIYGNTYFGNDSCNSHVYIYGGSGNTALQVVTGNVLVGSSTVHTSDARLKQNWRDIAKYDGVFDALVPWAFQYIYNDPNTYHLGFKAQDVRDALLANGMTEDDFGGFIATSFDKKSPTYHGYDVEYGLDYHEFIPLLVYEVQQLKAKVQSQAVEIEVLQAQLMV